MRRLQTLPRRYPRSFLDAEIRLYRRRVVPPANPMPWPCPVCGQEGDGQGIAILDLLYPDLRREYFVVHAHDECLWDPRRWERSDRSGRTPDEHEA